MRMHGHSHQVREIAPATQGRTIRWAQHYDHLVKLLTFGRENELRENTIHLAAIPLNASVLDVGCGTGSLTLLAKARAGDAGLVYGIDASPEMIAVAQHKAAQQKRDVNFQVGVIEALPFPDKTFDVVLSSLMFHHLPGDLKAQGLTEIYRVLKPGGRLLIVDMKRPTSFFQRLSLAILVHHRMASGVEDLIPMLDKVGFSGIQGGIMTWKALGFVSGQRIG